jgi:acetolactate synthase-1/3 small subunit
VDVNPETLIVEITGAEDKVEGLLEVLRPFGILELARTGRISMTRSDDIPTTNPEFISAQVPNRKVR